MLAGVRQRLGADEVRGCLDGRSESNARHRQLDGRRRFTETVLTGVSAGVIGVDRFGRVNLPNRSASLLLGVDLEQNITLFHHLAFFHGELGDLARDVG